MNGGRLSDDEAFLLGAGELRALLQAATPDLGAVERALTRIGVRYPDEAEQLRQLWKENHRRVPSLAGILAGLEAQYLADTAEE